MEKFILIAVVLSALILLLGVCWQVIYEDEQDDTRLLPVIPTVPRVCLKCLRPFASAGRWNRICHGCDRKNRDQNQPARCEWQGSGIFQKE